MVHIKAFAQLIGVSPETIRHYERLGILPEAKRAENGYRVYTDADKERLRFVGRARQLDISLENIANIIELRDNGMSPCDFVDELITTKIAEVEIRMRELDALRSELLTLQEMSDNQPASSPSACICQIIEIANVN